MHSQVMIHIGQSDGVQKIINLWGAAAELSYQQGQKVSEKHANYFFLIGKIYVTCS